MGSLPAHGRKRKFFRKGRHTAPSQVQKVARRAGMAAPAVAVVGALAAAPHVRDHAPTPGPQAAARPLSADQLQSSAAGDLAKLKAAYRAPHRERHHHAVHQAIADAQPASSASTGTIVRKTGGKRSGIRCSGASGPMLPENYPAIMAFLTRHGYTGVAAAGIAGNMYQESGGNPEAGDRYAGGLIGWTPLPAHYITGDAAADLQRQLEGVLTFNDQ